MHFGSITSLTHCAFPDIPLLQVLENGKLWLVAPTWHLLQKLWLGSAWLVGTGKVTWNLFHDFGYLLNSPDVTLSHSLSLIGCPVCLWSSTKFLKMGILVVKPLLMGTFTQMTFWVVVFIEVKRIPWGCPGVPPHLHTEWVPLPVWWIQPRWVEIHSQCMTCWIACLSLVILHEQNRDFVWLIGVCSW